MAIKSLSFTYRNSSNYSLTTIPSNYIIGKTPQGIIANIGLAVDDPSYNPRYPVYGADLFISINGVLVGYAFIDNDGAGDIIAGTHNISLASADYEEDVASLLSNKSSVIRISGVCTNSVLQTYALKDMEFEVGGINKVHYYTNNNFFDGIMRVYNDGQWVSSKLVGQLTKAVNSSEEILTDVSNNTLYIVEKEDL